MEGQPNSIFANEVCDWFPVGGGSIIQKKCKIPINLFYPSLILVSSFPILSGTISFS